MKLTERKNYIKQDRINDDGTVSVDRTYFIDSRLARREELDEKLYRFIYPHVAKGLRPSKQPYALHITGTIPAKEVKLWETAFHREIRECYLPLLDDEEDWRLYRESYNMRNNPKLYDEYTNRPPELMRSCDYPIALIKGQNYIANDCAVPCAPSRIWVDRIYLVLVQGYNGESGYETLEEIYAALPGRHAFGWFGTPSKKDYGLQAVQMPFGLNLCGEITKKQLATWEPVFHRLLSESRLAYFKDIKSWKRYLAQSGFDSNGEMI